MCSQSGSRLSISALHATVKYVFATVLSVQTIGRVMTIVLKNGV